VRFNFARSSSGWDEEAQVPFHGKGAVMLDLEGRIAFASTYFCDLVGISHDQAAKMFYHDFVLAEDLQEAKKFFAQDNGDARANPDAQASFRLRLRRSDGSPVWVDVKSVALQTAHGRVYAIAATVTPVDSLSN